MPNININTTHTVTCTDAPVEEVLHELQEKCPGADFNTYASKVVQLNLEVGRLTRERDEARKQLEESRAVKEKLMAENANLKAANEAILAAGSRPALPEGMRLAEHDEYGRVVVSQGADINGYYRVFAVNESSSSKAFSGYSDPSELTFLEEEPAPAPLPKPEDCKPGELYIAMRSGREVVANRCDPADDDYPWLFSNHDDGYADWCLDAEITLLARLLPDRKVQA